MRAELERVEANAGSPLANDAGILTCSEAATVDAPAEQEFAGLRAGNSEILVNGLPRLLCQLETDRATGLLLADRCSIECVAVGGHVIDAHRDDIAAAQFAVDGEVEQCEIARAALRAAASCGSTGRGLLAATASRRSACPYSTADGPADCSMGSLRFRS